MENYSLLYRDNDLLRLQGGFEILSRVIDGQTIADLDIWLYGITTDEIVLEAAKEVIARDTESFWDDQGNQILDESDIVLTEIGICVNISGEDAIDILLSGGTNVFEQGPHGCSFAYSPDKESGEGAKDSRFYSIHTSQVKIRADKMDKKAIAITDGWLVEYYKAESRQIPMVVNRQVQRNEEATQHQHTPEAPKQPAAATPPAGMPKQTSLDISKKTSLKISSLVEDLLGG